MNTKEIRKEMEEFLTHENQYVHECAERLSVLVEYLATDQISEDEFNELAEDVLDMERAAKAGKDVERAALIETGMRALISFLPQIVGLVTKK